MDTEKQETIKVIANGLISEYERRANCLVDEASDAAIKLTVIAGALSDLYDKFNFYDRQVYPNTAEGEYLIKHGQAKGIFKKKATKATGHIAFFSKEPATNDIFIPTGTLCTSSKATDAIYQTTADTAIAKGSVNAIAPIESINVGANANIAPDYIDILVSPITGVSSIRNPNRISGGANEEPDELFRQRVVESYSNLSNGVNLNYYEQWAKKQNDVWYAKAVYEKGTVNEIKLYVENATRTISDATIAILQENIESARELGMKVSVLRPIKKAINITATAYVNNLKNEPAYYMYIDEVFLNMIQSLSIGQRFSPSTAASKVLSHEGIHDINFYEPTSSIVVAPNEIGVYGRMSITIEKG